jgi:cytochrome c6
MKHVFLFAALAFAAVSCGSDSTPATTPTHDSFGSTSSTPPPAGAADGKALYEAKCTVCHGSDGKKGTMGAADLTTSTISHEAALTIIKNGKNSMTAFGGQFDESQLEAVAKYAESLRK